MCELIPILIRRGGDGAGQIESRIRPKLHLFGHFHGGAGLYYNRDGPHNTTHINTAMITLAGKQRLKAPWQFAWYYDESAGELQAVL